MRPKNRHRECERLLLFPVHCLEAEEAVLLNADLPEARGLLPVAHAEGDGRVGLLVATPSHLDAELGALVRHFDDLGPRKPVHDDAVAEHCLKQTA